MALGRVDLHKLIYRDVRRKCEMDRRTFARTWLAFTILQLIGNIWQCTNVDSFSRRFFRPSPGGKIPAIVPRLFLVHDLSLLLLRLLLVYYFDSLPLHVSHIATTTVSLIFFLLEMLWFQSLDITVPVISQLALSGCTVIIVIICCDSRPRETVRLEKRPAIPKRFLKQLDAFRENDDETKKTN